MMHRFEYFGLTHYESRALEQLLRGRATPAQVSKAARIPPGKVYSILKELQRKGFVAETPDRPKQLYVQDPAAVINGLIEGKQREDEQRFAELRRLATEAAFRNAAQSPFFELGATAEDNRRIQSRTFTEAKREVCQILNIHHHPEWNRTAKIAWERQIEKAVARGVRFRCIYPAGAAIPKLLQRLPADRFEVRRLDTDFVRCDIIDGRKVMVKLVHRDPTAFGGIIFLEDERFARNLQRVFEQLWAEGI